MNLKGHFLPIATLTGILLNSATAATAQSAAAAAPEIPSVVPMVSQVSYSMPAAQLRESPTVRPLPAAALAGPPISMAPPSAEPASATLPSPIAPALSPAPTPDTSQVLNADDALERSLSLRERQVLQSFAFSLPTYRSDPAQDGLLARTLDVVFPTPVAVRLGKLSVHGGIVTAVKTRNPFGLLNPEVLGLSW